MDTTFNLVAKLKHIRSSLRHGEQRSLARHAKVNEGQLAQYLIRPGEFDLNYAVVNKIIKSFDEFKNNK